MIVRLYELFGYENLLLRSTARKITREIDLVKDNITFDFKNIIFISRCFCHELYLGTRHRSVKFINMCSNVENMFEVVKNKKVEIRW